MSVRLIFSLFLFVSKQVKVNYSLRRLLLQMEISILDQVKGRFWLFVNVMARLCGVLKQARQFGRHHDWTKVVCYL